MPALRAAWRLNWRSLHQQCRISAFHRPTMAVKHCPHSPSNRYRTFGCHGDLGDLLTHWMRWVMRKKSSFQRVHDRRLGISSPPAPAEETGFLLRWRGNPGGALRQKRLLSEGCVVTCQEVTESQWDKTCFHKNSNRSCASRPREPAATLDWILDENHFWEAERPSSRGLGPDHALVF